MDKVKVLMIDDNVGLIGAVKEYFKSSKQIEIISEAYDVIEGFEKIKNAFENLEIQRTKEIENIDFEIAERVLTIRQAIFCESEEIDVQNALGRICASPTVSCPPAIPIAVSGEKITQKHIDLFTRYGIDKILVIKDWGD